MTPYSYARVVAESLVFALESKSEKGIELTLDAANAVLDAAGAKDRAGFWTIVGRQIAQYTTAISDDELAKIVEKATEGVKRAGK